MIFGHTAWSELPLSTLKTQIENGEDFDFDFIIDEILPVDFEIDTENDFDFRIDQILPVSLEMNQFNSFIGEA